MTDGGVAHGGNRRAIWAAALLATTMISGTVWSTPALAQAASAERSFDIPAQPLSSALAIFGRQSGLQVSIPADLANGRTSSAVSGTMTPRQALSRLLTGTGLTYRISGNIVTLERAPQASSGTVQLGTLRVGGATGGTGSGGTSGDWAGVADQPYNAPLSSEYRSAKDIQRFRGTTVGDIIAGIPGVLTGENRNSGGLDLNVRGMQGMNRVPVVVDGAQQSTVVYRGYSGVASRNYLDPDLLGEMVIEKGPSTRPEAVGATGGIMVARTISVDDIVQPGETFGIRVRGEIRSNTTEPPAPGTKGGLQTDTLSNRTWLRSCTPNPGFPDFCDRYPVDDSPIPASAYAQEAPPGSRPGTFEPTDGSFSIAAAKRWDNFEIVGAFAKRRAGNYFAGTNGPAGEVVSELVENSVAGGTRVYERLTLAGDTRFRSGEQVVNTAYDNTSYLLKGTLRLDGGHSLELGYNRFDSDYGDMMPSEIVRGEGFRQGEASNVVVDTYTARYRFNPETDLINLRANLWHKSLEVERNLYYGLILWLTSFTGDDPIFVPAAAEFSKRTGFDIDNTSKIPLGSGELTLRYGASYSWEDLKSAPYPELESGEYALDLTTDKHSGKREEASAFISGEWAATDWLQVDAALRYTRSDSYDRNQTRFSYRDENGQVQHGPWVNYELKADGFAPIFAATVEPWDGVKLYARYAEAIRTPSLFESTVGFSSGIDPRFPIKPERMQNREIGINYDGRLFGEDVLRVHAAYFDNVVDDYIARGGNWGGSSSNIEEAIFEGAEIRVEYDRGWVYGSIGGMYYFDLNYCLYPPEQPEQDTLQCHPDGVGFSDTQIPPKKSASGSLGFRLFDERLDVGTRVVYNGRRPDMTFVGSGRVNVRWTPHTIVDFYTSYEIDDHFSVDFNIDNLTDRYYADPLLIGITAAPGRTVRLGVTGRF